MGKATEFGISALFRYGKQTNRIQEIFREVDISVRNNTILLSRIKSSVSEDVYDYMESILKETLKDIVITDEKD